MADGLAAALERIERLEAENAELDEQLACARRSIYRLEDERRDRNARIDEAFVLLKAARKELKG